MASLALRLFTSAVLLTAAMAAPVPAVAQTAFDGSWSVLIVTDAGNCDPSYRFGVRIVGGRIYDESGSGAQVSGRVDRRGGVSVRVQQSGASAVGSGRLSRLTGGGRWQGISNGQRCIGRWRADRRG